MAKWTRSGVPVQSGTGAPKWVTNEDRAARRAPQAQTAAPGFDPTLIRSTGNQGAGTWLEAQAGAGGLVYVDKKAPLGVQAGEVQRAANRVMNGTGSYEDYFKKAGEYSRAAEQYNAIARGAANPVYRSVEEIQRDIDAIGVSVGDIETQQKALRQQAQALISQAYSRRGGTQQRVELQQQAQALYDQVDALDLQIEKETRRKAVLQKEYGYSEWFDYAANQKNADWEENSRYKTTKTGEEQFDNVRGIYTETGYADILYDYINGDKRAQEIQDLNDVGGRSTLYAKTHSGWKELPEGTVRMFNYLYATQGSEAAYTYLEKYANKGMTGVEAMTLGVLQGTGIASVSAAVGQGISAITGDEQAAERNAEWYGDLLTMSAQALQEHKGAYYAGSIAGNLTLMYGVGSAVGAGANALSRGVAIGGMTVQAAVSPMAIRVATGALSFAGANAIQNAGAAATGYISAGDYLKGISVSGIQGMAGGIAGGLVGTGMSNVLRKTGMMHQFMDFVGQVAGSMTNATVNQAVGYAFAEEKPSNEEIAIGLVTAFAISLLFSGINTYKTTQVQKARMQQAYEAVNTGYRQLLSGTEGMTPEQLAQRAQVVLGQTQSLRTSLNSYYIAGQQKSVNQMNAALDMIETAMQNYINGFNAAQAATQTPGNLLGGAAAVPQSAGMTAQAGTQQVTQALAAVIQQGVQHAEWVQSRAAPQMGAQVVLPGFGAEAPVANAYKNTAPARAEESTAVNTDPDQHTAAEQAVIAEYQAAVDEGLVHFVEEALENKGANKGRYTLKPVSARAATDIKALTGVDTTGFHTVMEQRIAEHIVDEHGPNGSTDHSMADVNDIGRIQYILDNYDTAVPGGRSGAYTTVKANGRTAQAQTVVFEKAVNGTYFVVEAVPDTKAKTAFVVSAYMAKNTKNTGTPHPADAFTPAFTSNYETANAESAAIPVNPTIPQRGRGVNTEYAQNGSPDAIDIMLGEGGSNGREIFDRNRGWDADKRAGGEAGILGEGGPQSATDAAREGIRRADHAGALRLEPVSARELGVTHGTDIRRNRVLPESAWDTALQETAARIYRETGKKTTFVLEPIQIRTKKGKVRNARGANTPLGIVIQANNLRVSVQQIADHELFHSYAERDPSLISAIEAAILENCDAATFQKVVERYIQNLRGVVDVDEGLNAFDYIRALENIKHEVMADAYAGINAFGAHAEQYQETARKTVAERGLGNETAAATERRTGPPETEGAGRYSISEDEIQAVQGIGRKSINDFSSADMAATERFAHKYWEEMGTKSPFFRAWFGDWRANDQTLIEIATRRGDARGTVENVDTGWNINVSAKVFNETNSHNGAVNISARPYLPYINDIVKKAVLLDSYALGGGKTKSANSLLMHSLYAVADMGSGPEVLKLYVEEMNDPNRTDTTKRAYQLQDIESGSLKVTGSGKNPSRINQTADIEISSRTGVKNTISSGGALASFSAADIETVADLFAAVKKLDQNFNPKESSKVVDEKGRPLMVYRGTDSDFTVFDGSKARADMDIQGNFFSPWDLGMSGYGRSVGACYLHIVNPADEATSYRALRRFQGQNEAGAKAREYLKSQGYDGISNENEEYIAFYPEQIKSAVDNIGTFDSKNPDIRYSVEDDPFEEAMELMGFGKADGRGQAKKGKKRETSAEAGMPKMSMEAFADSGDPVWNNLAYDDVEAQTAAMQDAHQEMVREGKVVIVPEETLTQVAESYPDLRSMPKKERVQILKEKMTGLKSVIRQFLNGLKGVNYEFEVNGNILDAKLYDTGIREVMEKVTQGKAAMLLQSDKLFQNARYLYSTPDYDGDPNIYRWNYFYSPVQIGNEVLGVRIAIRDVAQNVNHLPESQIYNWNIKKNATLGVGRPGVSTSSPGTSSVAPFFNPTIPQKGRGVNTEYAQNGSPDAIDIMLGEGGSNGREIFDRNRGWDADKRAGGEAGILGEGGPQSAADTAREGIRRADHAGALRLEAVSARELGVTHGTDIRRNRVLPESAWDTALEETAARIYRETGKKTTFVLEPIQIRTKKGKVRNARGANTPLGIVIQANNLRVSVQQIADHELFHSYAERDPSLISAIEAAILEKCDAAAFQKVVERYIQNLRGVVDVDEGLNAFDYIQALENIKHEVMADAYAGINAFGAHAEQYQETARKTVAERRFGNETAAATERRTGPPETTGAQTELSLEAEVQRRRDVQELLSRLDSGEITQAQLEEAAELFAGRQYSLNGTDSAYEGRDLSQDGAIYSYAFLTAQPDMRVTVLPDLKAVRTDGRVDTRTVVDMGMKNASKVGREQEDGRVLVRNNYTGRNLMVSSSSIRHGINGGQNRILTNARLGAVIGNVVQNAIPVNALRNKAPGVTGTYAMAAYAADDNGREFVAIVTVEERTNAVSGVDTYDVTHAVSGRQKKGSQASTKLQGFYPIKATTITIADVLKIVNETHQSILSENVLNYFGESRDPAGDYSDKVRFSLSDTDRQQFAKDGRHTYSEDEIQAVQGIGRKSINDFSSADMAATERFAHKYWEEMGTKSPFFRAWFGDWRANDQTRVEIADQRGDARGTQRNGDTGWDIQVSGKVFNETKVHNDSYNLAARPYLPYINDIVKKAVLLDSYAMGEGKTKSANSLLMHSLYAVADMGSGPEIIKLYVEEMHDPNRTGTAKRAYQLQNVEKYRPTAKSSQRAASSISAGADIQTVADLHAAVKSRDKNFNPKTVNSVLLNEDGEPKVFYHGTDAEFYGFALREIAFNEGPYFFAENRESAEAYGGNVFEVYLSGRNLANYDKQPLEFYRLGNKRDQVAWLKERGYDGWYTDMDSGGRGELSVFSPEQIKSAVDNIGTFDSKNPDIRYSVEDDPFEEAMELMGFGKAEASLAESSERHSTNDGKGIDNGRYRRYIKEKGIALGKQEQAQIQSARMSKYGGMKENAIPRLDYVFAHDKFYVLKNRTIDDYSVLRKLDPAEAQRKINRVMEEIGRETGTEGASFDQYAQEYRNERGRDHKRNASDRYGKTTDRNTGVVKQTGTGAHTGGGAGENRRELSNEVESEDEHYSAEEDPFEEAMEQMGFGKAAATGEAKGVAPERGEVYAESKDAEIDDDERFALLSYKSSASYKLNAMLRDGEPLTPEWKRMAEGLDRALVKLPVYKGTVYRRLSFDLEGQEALEAFLAEHAEGEFVRYPAFTSASAELDGYPVEGSLTVTQIISSRTGKDLDGIGNNFEKEIVFPRRSSFVVERTATDAQGNLVIYMREVTEYGVG